MEILGLVILASLCSLGLADIEDLNLNSTVEEMTKVCHEAKKSQNIELIAKWRGNFFSVTYSPRRNQSGGCRMMNLRFPTKESMLYSVLAADGYKQMAMYNLTDDFYVRTEDAKDVRSPQSPKLHFFPASSPPWGDPMESLLYALDCYENDTMEFFIDVGEGNRDAQQKALDRAGFYAVDIHQCSSDWAEIEQELK